jgi:hypothetical protein
MYFTLFSLLLLVLYLYCTFYDCIIARGFPIWGSSCSRLFILVLYLYYGTGAEGPLLKAAYTGRSEIK